MSHHEAFEHHDHAQPAGKTMTCRVCKSTYSHEQNPSHFRICNKCGYKILIVLLIVMVVLSYMVWSVML